MRVVITGGAGYIGTHVAIALTEAGHSAVLVDDLSNSTREMVRRVEQITGTAVPLEVADASDAAAVESVLREHAPVDAVIHLAGLKAVADSTTDPIRYYRVNLGSAISVLEAMRRVGVSTIVFSSSAAVYGAADVLPVTEESPTGVDLASPYGRTKSMIEELIADAAAADPTLRAVSLRYFNPVGAHPSGLIGENPRHPPTNLMPIVARAALGEDVAMQIFGDDYPTVDGTAERDYLHVQDLARGHIAALEGAGPGHTVYNLGTGRATTVLQLIRAFESASGRPVPYRVTARRPGDLARSYADPSKAERELGWRAELTVQDACLDAWRWQTQGAAE